MSHTLLNPTTASAVRYIGAFGAGFALMVVELTASRVVAPLIGASVFTWTAVIGVTLLGLSVGNVVGGVLADRYLTRFGGALLLAVCWASALAVLLINPLSHKLEAVLLQPVSILVVATLISGALFLLPAVLLGILPPLLYTAHSTRPGYTGRVYGRLSGMWSLGSIFGVFMTGFYFIATIGTRETLLVVAAALFALGGLLFLSDARRSTQVRNIIVVVLMGYVVGTVVSPSSETRPVVIFEKETPYYDAKVVDFQAYPELGKNRILLLDVDSHSIDTERASKRFYTDLYPVFGVLSKDIRSISVIGAGAYTLPKHFSKYYPNATVTVVEIDPELEHIGREYFNLDDHAITTQVGDARQLFSQVTSGSSQYDVIYGDAYSSFVSVPWYLLTQEYLQDVRSRLSPRGIYAINFIGTLNGHDTRLFDSVYKTFGTIFPERYVFALGNSSEQPQNITIIGVSGGEVVSDREFVERLNQVDSTRFLSAHYVPRRSLEERSTQGLLLTDNFAPVEAMMIGTMEGYFKTYIPFYHEVLG